MEKYIDLSREELIKRLETLELEKEQSLHVYEDLEKMQRDYQSQEKLAILKAAVNVGDSLIWEYDVKNDIIHLDYELNIYGGKNSRLKIEPFRKKEDFLKTIYPEDRQNVFYDHFIRENITICNLAVISRHRVPCYIITIRLLAIPTLEDFPAINSMLSPKLSLGYFEQIRVSAIL